MMPVDLFRKGKNLLRTVLLALLASSVLASAALAEKRVALVIGNGKYEGGIGALTNPPNDAKMMAEKLTALGFEVIKLVNGDQKAMKRAISQFGEKLVKAGPDSVGLFFYAGHGVQIGGENYLIPVGAEISKEADADIEAVSANGVIRQMEFAGNRVNIVLLDACRNNPLTRSFRGGDRGLARMDAPTGTFIGYSTAPGEVAADGNGKNSPYVVALSQELGQPGVPLEETFRNVRVRVMSDTADQQVPWDSSSLTGAFFFKPGAKVASVAPAPAPAAPAAADAEAGSTETMFWKAIENSTDPAEYQAYLDSYPNGKFAKLARARVASYSGGNVTSTERATKPAPEPEQAEQQAALEPVPPSQPAPEPEPEPEIAAPAPAPEPVAEPEAEEAAPSNAPAGSLVLSPEVAGMLDKYLAGKLNNRSAFAVSPDGFSAGYYICPERDGCVAGPKGLKENRDLSFAQNEAKRKCEAKTTEKCTLLFLRGDQRQPFARP